ncbi:MAG: CHAD domain-containing protein [Phycisphaerales bacterium]
MSDDGPSKVGDAAPVPGEKWFARFALDSGGRAASALVLGDRLGRLRGAIEKAMREPSGKRIRKLRVATRRADTAIRFAAPLIGPGDARRARRRLRSLRRAGGAVRRCDLFIERLARLLDDAAAMDVAPAATAMVGRLAGERASALDRFVDELARHGGEAWRTESLLPAEADGHTEETVPGTPDLALRLVREAGAAFAESAGHASLDIEPLHGLRLRGKRLRYAAELAAPVIGEPAAAELIQSVVPLQNELGVINDLAELADELSCAMSQMACLPGAGALVSGAERLFLISAAERDRRLGLFARARADRLSLIARGVDRALEARPVKAARAEALRLTGSPRSGTA